MYEATVMVLCTSFRRRKQHTGVNKMYVGDIPLQNDYQFLFFFVPRPTSYYHFLLMIMPPPLETSPFDPQYVGVNTCVFHCVAYRIVFDEPILMRICHEVMLLIVTCAHFVS